MRAVTFETTTAIGVGADIFNSETQGLDAANAVYVGFSIMNTGSQVVTVIVETKTHPTGSWTTQGVINANTIGASNIDSRIFRKVTNITAGATNGGTIAANTNGFLSCFLRFVYAIRIRATAPSAGNSVRVRGCFKYPSEVAYRELPKQTFTAGTVTSGSVPIWTDVSEYYLQTIYYNCSGTAIESNIGAGVFPGNGNTQGGMLLGVRYFPGDTPWYLDSVAATSIYENGKLSLVVQANGLLTTARRRMAHIFYVEAAYELGFLWNVPGGSTVDYYISLNG